MTKLFSPQNNTAKRMSHIVFLSSNNKHLSCFFLVLLQESVKNLVMHVRSRFLVRKLSSSVNPAMSHGLKTDYFNHHRCRFVPEQLSKHTTQFSIISRRCLYDGNYPGLKPDIFSLANNCVPKYAFPNQGFVYIRASISSDPV